MIYTIEVIKISIKSIKDITINNIYSIEYFYNSKEGTYINTYSSSVNVKERSLYVMNHICQRYLTSISSYKKAIKEIFNITYSSPLVLSDDLIFIQSSNIQSYENIWINFNKIKNIKKDNKDIIMEFKSGNSITITNKANYFNKQIELINIIYNYYEQLRYFNK